MLLKVVGVNLRRFRKEAGYTIIDLEADACIGKLGKIELGLHNPTLRTLRKLTKILPVDLYELFDEGNGTYTTVIKFIEHTLPLRDQLNAAYDPLLLLDLFGVTPLDKITVNDVELAALQEIKATSPCKEDEACQKPSHCSTHQAER